MRTLTHEVQITNLSWPADAALMASIPDKEMFFFYNANVDILPRYFTDPFKRCIRTEFYDGVVKTIHISPKLTRIQLSSTSTENVIIERGKYYQLENFKCNYAQLTRIPENIDQLKKIKHLNLNYNLIQTVQLDQFHNLDNLETLHLTDNEIKHIHNYGSVSLPSLNHLHLSRNQLQNFDVCSWNMPSLSNLHLHDNFLTHFAIDHFRGLKQLNIARNPLNCDWKNRLLREKSDVTIRGELTCHQESEGIFGLDCASTIDQLRQQNSTHTEDSPQANFDSSSSQTSGTVLIDSQQFFELSNKVQQLEAEIKQRLQTIEALLENLGTKMVEQQNVSNDIIEAFYRAEIERTYGTTKSALPS